MDSNENKCNNSNNDSRKIYRVVTANKDDNKYNACWGELQNNRNMKDNYMIQMVIVDGVTTKISVMRVITTN